ncbi:MAG TPA: hypothetical protein VF883_20650 [Thermoanaerobaculia bacterium]|jgi:hypothetical protein
MTQDPENDVFNYGDRTIFQLRAQSFTIENEYGTMIGPLVLPAVETGGGQPEAPVEAVPEDPIARLELKLERALQMIATLQHKLDSIDATLARALNR